MSNSRHQLGPIEVPWKWSDAIMVFVLAWIGAPLLIVVGVHYLAPYIPALQQLGVGLRNNDITASFVFAVVDALAALVVLSLYLGKCGASWRDLGFHNSTLSSVSWALALRWRWYL